MALGDTDDLSCSQHGRRSQVVLYCHTCQLLLCTRCVSHGPSGDEPAHRDHMYLEVGDACEMFKGELEKLVGKLSDHLQQQKNIKLELQARIQKLKLELLRHRTVLHRRSVGLHDTIKRKECTLRRHLETVLQPALERNEERYRDVDYEVVSGDGLVGTADSLRSLPPHRYVTFIKSFHKLKKSIEDHISKTCDIKAYKDELDELKQLQSIDLTFQREAKLLSQAFLCPQKVLQPPRILRNWSTVGATSASIVWRHNSNISNINSFQLYFRPLLAHDVATKIPLSDELSTKNDAELCQSGFRCVRINRFLPKRSQAVLRDLNPGSQYVLAIFAVNRLTRSSACVTYFRTSDSAERESLGSVSSKPAGLPASIRQIPLHRKAANVAARGIRILFKLVLFFYIVLTFFIVVFYRDRLLADFCLLWCSYEISTGFSAIDDICQSVGLSSVNIQMQSDAAAAAAAAAGSDDSNNESLFTWFFTDFV